MLARSNDHPRSRSVSKGLKACIMLFICLLLIAGFNQQFPEAARQIRSQISVQTALSLTRGAMDALDKAGFPRQFLLLEGMPYLGRVNSDLENNTRTRMLTISFYTLTRVDITDPRSFFSAQLPVPGVDPLNLAAYNPADPEQEGPIIEVVDEPPPTPAPGPPGTALVGIYTSHNSESYEGDGGSGHESGQNGEISQVAAALAVGLQQDGMPAVRSDIIHDMPKLELAYSKSVKTATQMLADNPNLQTILDIHRDGLPDGKEKRTVSVNGKPASPVLIVLGTKHDNWQKNEQFAKDLVAKGNAKYPGLFLPIYYATDARYNQHLHPHALLLEFGDQYNTTTEAETAAQAVADVLTEIIKKN